LQCRGLLHHANTWFAMQMWQRNREHLHARSNIKTGQQNGSLGQLLLHAARLQPHMPLRLRPRLR
jgi:hypothetical protein